MKSNQLFTSIVTIAAIVLTTAFTRADESPTFKTADEITKQIVVEGRIAFEQKALPFKFDSTELADESALRQLVEIAKALQSDALKDARFAVEGHTCDLGAEDYNLDLSKRRAAAIKALLKKAGISSDRIEVDGKGEKSPAVENTNEAARAKNRRVEIRKIS